jgi:Ubiquitin-2 like Rad60 SUMO-like
MSSDDDDGSSSGGEPEFESPENSGAEDEDDDVMADSDNGSPSKGVSSHKKNAIDPFKFKAKSFQKVNIAITSAQHPSPAWRKRTRVDDASELERSLRELERKSEARLLASQQKFKKRKKSSDDENDSDDDEDSDMEALGISGSNDTKSMVSSAAKTNKENKLNDEKSSSMNQPQEVIELSSDDEKHPPGSAAAKNPSSSSTATTSASLGMGTRRSTGHAVLGTASSSSSKKQPPVYSCSSDDDSDKETPVGSVTRLLQQRNAPLPASVADIMRRARKAQSSLTQAQHYHAHELYVPVKEAELIHHRRTTPLSTQKPMSGIKAAALNLGVPLKLTCRTQIDIKGENKKRTQEVTISIRDQEPLQVLFDKLFQELALPPTATLTMCFDGILLEKTKTPKSYEMENEDLVDCAAEATHLLATKGKTTFIPTSFNLKKAALGIKLKLNCRAQIKITGMQQQKKSPAPLSSNLELREHEALSLLLDQLIKVHKIPSTAKVSMSFDGDICNLEKTPNNYGMETNDLVDFTVEVESLWL